MDDQLNLGREWATSNDRELVAVLRDDGISASRYARGKQRPDWQKAMELISTGQLDDLWVWEVSRSSRDRAVWAALLAALLENNVMLVVNGRSHDPADPDDGFMLDLAAALAVRESAVTSKRVKRGTASRAQRGEPHGALQYGYRRVIDPNTGDTIGRDLHPEQAAVVREVVRRVLDRETLNGIAADLNRRGIQGNRGGRWIGGNIRQMVLNPSLAGLRVYHGEVMAGVEVTWPPLISISDHHRLKAMFGAPERDQWRNSTAVKHLGSGLYRCGREGCDGVMRVRVSSVDSNAYSCRTCFRVTRNQAETDRLVEKVVTLWLSKPTVLAAFMRPDSDDTQRAQEEAADIQAELDGLYADVAAGRLSRQALWSIEPGMRARLAEAERRARPRSVPPLVFDVAGPDAGKKFEKLDIKDKRRLLASLVTVTILPAGVGKRFDPDLIDVQWIGTPVE